MAPIIPPDHLFAQYRHSLAGDDEEMLTTCGHQWDSGSVTIASAADLLADAWVARLQAQTSNLYTFLGVRVLGTTTAGSEVFFEENRLVVGGDTAAPPPQNTTLLVRKVTGLRGRRNRGRMYPPGQISEAGVSSTGQVDSGTLAARQGAWTNFLQDCALVGLDAVILHSELPSAPAVVTGMVVDQVVATQRRRLRS